MNKIFLGFTIASIICASFNVCYSAEYWAKTYGCTGIERTYSIEITAEGGYVVAGHTTSFGAGNYDFWVIKLDGSGNIIWQKTYGGTNSEHYAYSNPVIQQTLDAIGNPTGYVVAGTTTSFGAGNYDFWVIKLDNDGNIIWQKTYGESGEDQAHSIQQTLYVVKWLWTNLIKN